VAGLRLGADDYLTKPFSPREMVARVEAILRRNRSGDSRSPILHFEHVAVNPDSHEALVDGQLLDLTVTEFQVLWQLARHPGRVLTRDQLLEQVWGSEFYGNDRVVDVYVGQVRRKLSEISAAPLIETVRGVGYKFIDKKREGDGLV
jgi:two-component system alkaline phosphatase synthesis response regulator PhoP